MVWTDIKAWPAVLLQLLQDPPNHYLEVIHFFTSGANEIGIRVTAVCCNATLSFIESLRSWNKGLSLFNSTLRLLKEPAKYRPSRSQIQGEMKRKKPHIFIK